MKVYRILFCVVILTMFLVSGLNASCPLPYCNDFSCYIGSEWSSTGGPLTISTTPSGEKFLGRDPLYGLQNEIVSLAFTDLPMNMILDVSFDLYIINSWDGNNTTGYGPDYWSFGVAGEQELLYTTFSSAGEYDPDWSQSYPDNYFADNPGRTGAAENNTLGYLEHSDWEYNWDSIYKLNFIVPYTGNSVTLEFAAFNLQEYSFSDESWGLDNVSVAVIPEPGTFALCAIGILGLVGYGWRRKRKA